MISSVSQQRLLLPPAPLLVAGRRHALLFSPDGELRQFDFITIAHHVQKTPPIVCHLPSLTARLSVPSFPAYDVLELFAFVHPTAFCPPTVRGLASACSLTVPDSLEDQAQSLLDSIRILLRDLSRFPGRETRQACSIAHAMAHGGWSWASSVLAALGNSGETPHRGSLFSGLRVWEHLPEVPDHAPLPCATHTSITPSEARGRLAELLGPDAEDRPQQADYASACCEAFAPTQKQGEPHIVLAEAGTGVGKTLGYIAPASLWADKNGGLVCLSTYTRNLQRQLDAELTRLYPDPALKARQVVVRKGRENYLCLLNMEEAIGRLSTSPEQAVALGLVARWALTTRDGDMVGGDFPGWLPDIAGRVTILPLLDQRGECIFATCPHYQRCFIERSVRKAQRARLVIANHALVMTTLNHMTLGPPPSEDLSSPTRYVFDEGHHLFDAADTAFSAHLSGRETSDLRHWLLGSEETGRSRARGLKKRLEEIVDGSDDVHSTLRKVLIAAHCLPGPSWLSRLAGGGANGPTERFLALIRQQVHARARNDSHAFSLETDVTPLLPGLRDAAAALHQAYETLIEPLKALCRILESRLDTQAKTLESGQRLRIERLVKSLNRRVLYPLSAWKAMLDTVLNADRAETSPDCFVDWFTIERLHGREINIGMSRHWIDPTQPLAHLLSRTTHGVVITSATLRDGSGHPERDWEIAEEQTGVRHLPTPPIRAAVTSPFRYHEQTRVMVVTDVRKDDFAQIAAAYRDLFLAAQGGGLGLFTAISRLKEIHQRIAIPLDDAMIPLYAQHVDGMDTSTLIDIFRAEKNACLLGTDAVRDGVDVPGSSLRLIVFDRVPWPRPDILHRARRTHFGKIYDDRLTRLRLKQAFGRLIRRAEDRGVFILLDRMMPSRLAGAFPDGVEIRRLGLAEAIAETKIFLAQP